LIWERFLISIAARYNGSAASAVQNSLSARTRLFNAPSGVQQMLRPGSIEYDLLLAVSFCLYYWSLDVNLPVMTRLSNLKPTILAVDDNADNLVLLEYQLQDFFDCSLRKASCGYDALAQIKVEIPDLLLLDIVLPDINGMDVARQLRSCSRTANLPIIAVTASARLEDRDRILDSGCTGYLSKPYDISDLESLIHLHLKACHHP
jgi:two-component system, cell cycle response regulator DivK